LPLDIRTAMLLPPGKHPRVGAAVSTQREACYKRGPGVAPLPRGGGAGAVVPGSAAGAVGVTGQRAFYPVPGRARGVAGIVPVQARVAAAGLVLAAQVRLGLVEIAVGVARAALVAGAVGRGVVVVAELRVVVALLAVVLAPVGLFDRRVHALAHGLAGEPARDRAHR